MPSTTGRHRWDPGRKSIVARGPADLIDGPALPSKKAMVRLLALDRLHEVGQRSDRLREISCAVATVTLVDLMTHAESLLGEVSGLDPTQNRLYAGAFGHTSAGTSALPAAKPEHRAAQPSVG